MAKSAEDYKNLGNECYKQEDYDQAIEYYTKAIESSPATPAYYANRAAAYMSLTQYEKALEDCTKALALEPNNVKVYLRAGKCNFHLGSFNSAIENYRQALQIEPNNAQAHKELELVNSTQTKLDHIKNLLAKENYGEALSNIRDIPIDSCQIRLFQAEGLIGVKQYAHATRIVSDIHKQDENNLDALFLRAKCMYYLGHMENAEAIVRKILNMDPDHRGSQTLFRRMRKINRLKEEGNELFKARRYNDAISRYQEVIQEDPRLDILNATMYANIAASQMGLGNYEDAERNCTRALDIDVNYDKALARRAKCRIQLEKYQEAVNDYEDLKKKNSSFPGIDSLIREAQLELKKSQRKDYYKILGVGKNASTAEIKKAYRKQALTFHPDKIQGSDEDKKSAEAKFKDITEAHAVLSDDKKRARYDSGADLSEEMSGFSGMNPQDFFRYYSQQGGGGGGFGGPGFDFFR